MIEEWKIGYLAGIIDGEGYVGITVSSATQQYRQYRLKVTIGNTNLELLSALQKDFGGIIGTKPKEEKCKKVYYLNWPGEKAKEILSLVSSKLIVKRQQAEMLSQYPIGYQGEETTDDVRVIREALYLLLKKLNKRGDGESP